MASGLAAEGEVTSSCMRVTIEISEAAAETLLRAEAADFGHESVAALLRRRQSTRREAVRDVVQCIVDARVELSYEREVR